MAKKRVLNPHVKGGFSSYTQGELSDGERLTLKNARAHKEWVEENKYRKSMGQSPTPDPLMKLKKGKGVEVSDETLAAGGGDKNSTLSQEERDKVEAGMSIPEMKSLAKKRKIVIPSVMKKKADIASYILNPVSGENLL